MTDLDELTTARQRIAAAYDPRLLQDAGHRLADLLGCPSGPGGGFGGRRAALGGAAEGVRQAAEFSERILCRLTFPRPELAEHFARSGAGDARPRPQPARPALHRPPGPGPVPLGGLFDAVGSVTNQVMAIYEMGPWATAVEQAMVAELGAAIGWAAGHLRRRRHPRRIARQPHRAADGPQRRAR